MTLREFPLGLPGRVFGSPMPFGYYDPEGSIVVELKREGVSVIVLLADDDECIEKAGRNLTELYMEHALTVIPLPIKNYGVPTRMELGMCIERALRFAREGKNILVHCSAGIGRTAFVIAFLAISALRLSGREAIRWIAQHHPDALLTPGQIEMILEADLMSD